MLLHDPPVPAQRAGRHGHLQIDEVLGDSDALLQARLDELLSSGVLTLEVDVSTVPVMRVPTLRRLVVADLALRRRGGWLRLVGASPSTLRLLAMSRASRLVDRAHGGAERLAATTP